MIYYQMQRPIQLKNILKLYNNPKRYNFLFSSRVFEYGPIFSWMSRRTHSEKKIEPQFKQKKKMFIDEQLIQIKQYIKDSKKFIETVKKAKPFSVQEQKRVKSLVDQLTYKQMLLHKRCKFNSYKIEKHCRNYSQPKFKLRSQYPNHRPFPQDQQPFQENLYQQPQQYFKNSMDDQEFYLLQCRLSHESNYQTSLTARLDVSRAIIYINLIIAAICAVGQSLFRDIFSKKIMIPILKDRGLTLSHSQQRQLEYIFEDQHMRSMNPWFIRKSRNFKLRDLAQELCICVEKDYIFDMRKLFEPSKYSPELAVFYSPPIRNLAEIKNIKPLASPAGANEGEHFEVEFQLGLKTVLSLSELQRQHKWAYEDYQQGLFS